MTQENFEVEQNSIIKRMLEACFEYVDFNKEEVEFIYLFGYYKSKSYSSISYFYKINGIVTGVNDVNDFLSKKCDNSDEVQFTLSDYLGEEFSKLKDLFLAHQNEFPIITKVKYSLLGKLNTSYEYNQEKYVSGDVDSDDFELEWIEELKKE